jgi:hypothetical protein
MSLDTNKPYAIRLPKDGLKNELFFIALIKRFLFPTIPEGKIVFNQEGLSEIAKGIQGAWMLRSSLDRINFERSRSEEELPPMDEEGLKLAQRLCELEFTINELKPGHVRIDLCMTHFFMARIVEAPTPDEIRHDVISTFFLTCGLKNNLAHLLFSPTHVDESFFESGAIGITPRPVANFVYEPKKSQVLTMEEIFSHLTDHLGFAAFKQTVWTMGLPADTNPELVPFIDIASVMATIREAVEPVQDWGNQSDKPMSFRYYAQCTPDMVLPSEDSGRLVVRWAWNHVVEISFGRLFSIPIQKQLF